MIKTWLTGILVPALVNHLWQTTAVLQRNRASLRYRLWMLASLKFFVPFSLLIELGGRLKFPAAKPIQVHSMSNLVADAVQPYNQQKFFPAEATTALDVHSQLHTHVAEVFISLWIVGTFLILASWLRTWIRLHNIAREAAPWTTVSGLPVRITSSLIEPGLFGIFRPVLLFPDTLVTRLSEDELEAIFAHELCHLRRRDNLASVVHMLVSALFWFHPGVWLVRSQLLNERERACDEAVVSSGKDRELYAQSILNVCKVYVETSTGAWAGAAGGNLKQRVVAIMNDRGCASLNTARKVLLAAAVFAMLGLPLLAGLGNPREVRAQAAGTMLLPLPNTKLPEFEAATVKPTSSPYAGIYVKPGGRIEGGNCPVIYLVSEAFNIPDVRITGGPEWIKQTKFDITAVPPDDSAARKYIPVSINSEMIDDQRLMLQALLRDRFGFKYHVAQTEQSVLFLRRTGKPLKLNPPKDPKSRVFMGVNTFSDGKGNGEIVGGNTTMAYTALRLSTILRRIVIDQTGLSDAYDFHVDAPDEKDANITDATFEGLKTLGLELKPGRYPVDSIVIDAVTQPTPN